MRTVFIITDLVLIDAGSGLPTPLKFTLRDVDDQEVGRWKVDGWVTYDDDHGTVLNLNMDHVVELLSVAQAKTAQATDDYTILSNIDGRHHQTT